MHVSARAHSHKLVCSTRVFEKVGLNSRDTLPTITFFVEKAVY